MEPEINLNSFHLYSAPQIRLCPRSSGRQFNVIAGTGSEDSRELPTSGESQVNRIELSERTGAYFLREIYSIQFNSIQSNPIQFDSWT